MKSIEFIGPPGSGKSFYKKGLLDYFHKEKIYTFDTTTIFYEKYPFLFKVNLFKLLFFRLKKIIVGKDNYLFRLINYYFDKIYDFKKEYLFLNNRNILKKFTEEYFKIFDKYEKKVFLRNKLKKWLSKELPSIYLSKKIKSKFQIFINSEGINQRIIRLILNQKKKSYLILNRLNYNFFESDILVFIDTKPKKCMRRLKKRSSKKYTKNEIQNFYDKSKILFKKSKKIKFKIDANSNSDKVFMKILKILTHTKK